MEQSVPIERVVVVAHIYLLVLRKLVRDKLKEHRSFSFLDLRLHRMFLRISPAKEARGRCPEKYLVQICESCRKAICFQASERHHLLGTAC